MDYLLDDDGHLPLEGGIFDGVLSTQVLEHVPDPMAYLHEAMRVLRPGRRLVLTTHAGWGHIDRYSDLHLRGLRRAPAGEHCFYLALLVSARHPCVP